MNFFNASDQVLFRKYFWEYLQMALFYPSNLKVLALALILGFAVFTVVFIKVHSAGGGANAGTLTGMFTAFFSLLALSVMPPLARVYIMKMKSIARPEHYTLWTIAATVFIFLGMVVPFSPLLFAFMVVAGTGYVHDSMFSAQKKESPSQLNEPMPLPSQEEVNKTLDETKKDLQNAAEQAKTAVEKSSEKLQELKPSEKPAPNSMDQAEEALREAPAPSH
jgi:hypothetical protein